MTTRKHFIRLAGPNDPNPLQVTTWTIEAGWLRLVEDKDDTAITTLIPPTWPMPIGITTVYENDDE